MRRSLLAAPFLVCSAVALFAACGGDEAAVSAPPSAAGSAGKSGAGGAGAAGTGAGGTAGKAGSSGASAGTAGTSGGGGTGSACKVPADCVVPTTVPAGCAEALCEAGACKLKAKDADGDGQRAATCAPAGGGAAVIELGTDCNDGNKDAFVGAWDGPATDGKPNRCGDGVDQDCSGVDGDGKGAKGESCTCTPGDVQDCDQDEGGKPIVFPGGTPQGACSRGKRTCVVDAITKAAVFTACIGAKGPVTETCNGNVDDDCDGKADMADTVPPLNTATWSYDGDSDGFVKEAAYRVEWCGDERPTVCPAGQATCDKTKWKLANLPSGDCDDASEKIRVGGAEVCNGDGKDYNCNGKPNTPGVIAGDCACKEGDQVICAPSDKNYPASITKPSDKYPLPGAIDLQAGNLLGQCRWGTKECINGQWTTCHDGVGAQPIENCALPDKKDYDCNGVPNQAADGSPTADCSCTSGQTRLCGECNKGTQACSGGTWGNCSGDDVPLQYCDDADGDKYCTAQCRPECPGADHTGRRLQAECAVVNGAIDCIDNDAKASPVADELCTATDENCDKNAYGPTFAEPGSLCNNGKVGSCYKEGAAYCASPSVGACDAGEWPGFPSSSRTDVPVHGSYDMDCDGLLTRVEPRYVIRASFPRESRPCAVGGANYWKFACDKVSFGIEIYNVLIVCDEQAVDSTHVAPTNLSFFNGSGQATSACGATVVQVSCYPDFNGIVKSTSATIGDKMTCR